MHLTNWRGCNKCLQSLFVWSYNTRNERGCVMKYLQGTCLCQKVKFQIPDKFEMLVGSCHASDCQKFLGSTLHEVNKVSMNDLKIIEGKELVAWYHKNEHTDLAFCRSCGSKLFSKKLKKNKRNICFDLSGDDPKRSPTLQIFAEPNEPLYQVADWMKYTARHSSN